jgi:hypothetical protein
MTRPMAAGTFDLAARISDAAGAARMSDATGTAERRGCPTVLGRRGFSWRRHGGRDLMPSTWPRRCPAAARRRGLARWRLLGTTDHGGRSWGAKPRRPELGTKAAAAGVWKCSRDGRRRECRPRRRRWSRANFYSNPSDMS